MRYGTNQHAPLVGLKAQPAGHNQIKTTMTNYNLSGRSFNTVRTDQLSATDSCRFAYFNRQSDKSNAHGHERNVPRLAVERARLSPTEPFNPHRFTGSGDAGILRDAFNSDNVDAVLAGTYFEDLANALKRELQNTQKLCAVFPSIDRIFRPLGYDRHGGISTWIYTDEDYALFQQFLDYSLGAQSVDVQFAVLDDSPSAVIRSKSIKSGQATAGRRGGRPPNPKKEALRLGGHGWNAGRIRRYLLKRYKIKKSIRTIQLWLGKAGLASKPGHPKGGINAQS